MSINKAIILGRVGKAPELRYMTSGDAIASFSVATGETWKDKSGEKQEKTEWHNVTTFKRLAEVVGEYVKKGDQIYVEGKITTEKYTDKTGVEKYITKIIADKIDFIGGKREQGEQTAPTNPTTKIAPSSNKTDDFDNDIPF